MPGNEVAEKDFHRTNVSKICAKSQKYPINCLYIYFHSWCKTSGANNTSLIPMKKFLQGERICCTFCNSICKTQKKLPSLDLLWANERSGTFRRSRDKFLCGAKRNRQTTQTRKWVRTLHLLFFSLIEKRFQNMISNTSLSSNSFCISTHGMCLMLSNFVPKIYNCSTTSLVHSLR